MNKLLAFGCIAAVFTAISCQKEADTANPAPATGKLVPVTVEATVPETRVTLSTGGNLPAWTCGHKQQEQQSDERKKQEPLRAVPSLRPACPVNSLMMFSALYRFVRLRILRVLVVDFTHRLPLFLCPAAGSP